MTPVEPMTPVALVRRAREPGDGWERARSWFGGTPRLGGQAWPTGPTGLSLHFLAQVDLGELAVAAGRSALPSSGALAFFIGDGEGRALYVPDPDAAPAADAPPDLQPVETIGGRSHALGATGRAATTFARWPIEPIAAPMPVTVDEDGEVETDRSALHARVAPRQYFLGMEAVREAMAGAPLPVWRHSAQLFVGALAEARRRLPARLEKLSADIVVQRRRVRDLSPSLVGRVFGQKGAATAGQLANAQTWLERYEAQLEGLQSLSAAYERFVAEADAWANRSNTWWPLSEIEVAQLNKAYEMARKQFGEIARYHVPSRFDDLLVETLQAQMTAEDEVFALMPAPVRDLLNRAYRLPAGAPHQMFGAGVDIQGNAAAEHEGDVMLLQLTYDDMMGWRFGDMGAYQFWISPEALAAGRWEAVELTFECS